MKTEQNNLDRLKGKNPFTVPEGYMEGLTANIMSQLPEREPEEEVKKVSLMDRVRPWLYMAAVFAGLGLFFKVLVGPEDKSGENRLATRENRSVSCLSFRSTSGRGRRIPGVPGRVVCRLYIGRRNRGNRIN